MLVYIYGNCLFLFFFIRAVFYFLHRFFLVPKILIIPGDVRKIMLSSITKEFIFVRKKRFLYVYLGRLNESIVEGVLLSGSPLGFQDITVFFIVVVFSDMEKEKEERQKRGKKINKAGDQ